jgi:hypothetical protein
MAKPKKPSLADIAAADMASATTKGNVVTLQRDNAMKSDKAKHTSLYLHPKVRRAIQEIAFQYDKKPHDLYIEGIDLMLRQYGKPTSAELAGKK